MRTFPILLVLFFFVPLIEIYFLIQVGGLIGAAWTIFCVVFTAVVGAFLVRAQGFATLRRIRSQLDQGELPAAELLEGVLLLIAGALLMTPGFFTDAFGFALLTPPLRRALIRHGIQRGLIATLHRSGPAPQGRTFDGDFERTDR